jgi:formyltetrahydrofolate synthetase
VFVLLLCTGTPLPHAYLSPDVELVTAGCANLARHIENTRKYGVPVVVAINAFASDSKGTCLVSIRSVWCEWHAHYMLPAMQKALPAMTVLAVTVKGPMWCVTLLLRM